MTDFIRTIWQNTASANGAQQRKTTTEAVQPVDQIRLPPSAAAPSVSACERLIKLEPPSSPSTSSSASDSDSGKAQRMARVNARRDKRKPLEAADVTHASASKKLKTEAALDPSGEERLRAMEAQLEHLDPDSKEAKKKRRLIRNRMSAQLHRERKKAYVGQLEDQLQAKEKELKALQDQLAAMAVESEQLKQKLGRKESIEQEPQIKAEPVPLEKVAHAESVMVPNEPAVDWAACLEDMDEAMVGEDLLCDLDESPLAAIASRIVACLEKTSWEDFQDVSSWTTSAASAAAAAAMAITADKKSRTQQTNSPSAASDNEVTRRSVADMSTIRKGMSTGALFPTTVAKAAASSNDKLLETHDQSVTFLYPLSAFSEDQRSAAFPNGASSDQVFLEVSCQINGAAKSLYE
ncbi:bZIP transcription factor, putative [Phytophthora infestans T30-4]|uniref:BZIP transcription factor, putative n=1 Tax=Phytophthora infestans (strain T30-4) TaxID=403677 RepID=D0NBB1_PHYIT|nr:bZIP transcription factor, putative [Phytophthora infestans T30-4]EEY55340.1 bZIP transcription factor, putative [Phytophthora infestans T30-4]|eukprot:XP_002903564.1 bZIP transcription factor, putative [Phytophthora infestans T30-4]